MSEIPVEQQERLARQRNATVVDVESGVYPFRGFQLTRDDVEWLLATHGDGRGPVYWDRDDHQGYIGLDLRGANLQGVDLSGLPLARLIGGLTVEERQHIRDTHRGEDAKFIEERVHDCSEIAAVHLEGANLERAHLEEAVLRQAHLEAANLTGVLMAVDAQHAFLDFSHEARRNLQEAHLEGTDLRGAHLEGAILSAARLERAVLIGAHLEGADLFVAHLEGAYINDAHFEGRKLSSEDVQQFRTWIGDRGEDYPGFSATRALLKPADLRGVYFDNASSMWRANLGDTRSPTWREKLCRMISRKRTTPNDTPFGAVRLADARWEGANVSVIDWYKVQRLGDELDADADIPEDSRGNPKTPRERTADYAAAVRAYRQVATALQSQGSSEEASRYAYRAEVTQREVYRLQGRRGRARFSCFLDLIAGYGYKPERSAIAYLLVILTFAAAYFALGHLVGPSLSPVGAVVFSMTSFHGRGFFPGGIGLDDPITVLAALEALCGLIIEVSLIATFTLRFFGKGSGA